MANITRTLLNDLKNLNLSQIMRYDNLGAIPPGAPMAITYRDEFGRCHDLTELYLSGTFTIPDVYDNSIYPTGMHINERSISDNIPPGTFVNRNKLVCFYCGEEKNTIKCPNCGGSRTI